MAMNANFYRVNRLPPYVFAEINRLKAELRAEGRDIIDFGMGIPDMDTPHHIVKKMVETVQKPKVYGYSASKGITGLRRAQSGYYKRRWGVDIDPEEYLNHLDRAVRHSVPKPIAMVVSFPSNPTAQICDLDFYNEIIRFAKKHEIWVLFDLAYAEIYFNDKPTPSILEIEGAKDVAVEFTSMSKTFAMAGWRMGFAVGNRDLISALCKIKSYLDYGAFTPVQVAAAAALNGPTDPIVENRETYKARRDVLVHSMARFGWIIPSPPTTMFAWAPIPSEFQTLGSMQFAKLLLQEAGVAIAPGVGFGEYGEGFVRIGLVENEQRIRQAARNIKRIFSNATKFVKKYQLEEA